METGKYQLRRNIKWLKFILFFCIIIVFCIFAFSDYGCEYSVYNGFFYEERDDCLYIVGIKNAHAKSIVIPATINGYEVYGISEKAFLNNDSLESIVISDGIKRIGKNAFTYCRSLRKIIIPNTVIDIEGEILHGCDNLNEVELPFIEGHNSLKEYYSFLSATKLKKVKINSKNTIIRDKCFKGYVNLESIILPDEVEEIGNEAFSGCTSLGKIDLPESLTLIAERAFYNCQELTQLELPSSLTEIKSYAFFNCIRLNSVFSNVSDSQLKVIGDYAFYNCTNLDTVCINCNVEYGENSFTNSKITEITGCE